MISRMHASWLGDTRRILEYEENYWKYTYNYQQYIYAPGNNQRKAKLKSKFENATWYLVGYWKMQRAQLHKFKTAESNLSNFTYTRPYNIENREEGLWDGKLIGATAQSIFPF